MARSDARDLSTIYVAMRVPLWRFLRRRVQDAGTADDLLHDVFLRVHDHVDSLRDVRCLESWIYQIARNAVIDRQRRERPAPPVNPELLTLDQAEDNEAQRELAALVPRCIEYLPEPYREALRTTTFENVSHRELAARWGLSVSGAKSRVQRARRMLADLYRECCHLEFDARGKVIAYSPRARCCQRDQVCDDTISEGSTHAICSRSGLRYSRPHARGMRITTGNVGEDRRLAHRRHAQSLA